MTSLHRGNRYVVAVVMGGSSAGSRDARMRELIGQTITAASTKRTTTLVAELAGKSKIASAKVSEARSKAGTEVAAKAEPKPATEGRRQGRAKPDPESRRESGCQGSAALCGRERDARRRYGWLRRPDGAHAARRARIERSDPPGAGQDRDGQSRQRCRPRRLSPHAPATLPETAPSRMRSAPQVAAPASPKVEPARIEPAKIEPAKVEEPKLEAAKVEAPKVAEVQPPRPVRRRRARVASRTPGADRRQPPRQSPLLRTGWMIQVGAFQAEQEAKQRLSAIQTKASKIVDGTDPFTESVEKGGSTFYRARFAGFDKDKAEAACKVLKRDGVECVTIKKLTPKRANSRSERRSIPAIGAAPKNKVRRTAASQEIGIPLNPITGCQVKDRSRV